MTRLAIAALTLVLLSLPLRADGLEFALGLGILPTTQRGPAYPDGDPATALQLRLGWDRSPSYLRMTQWQFQAQSGSNADLRFATTGAGLQRSWWSRNHGFEGAVGTELRVERYVGRSSLGEGPSPLDGQVAWMVRPWLRGQMGFRGILIPLGRPSTDLLALLTQGGHYSHPFTRLEVALPLWNEGGPGLAGELRHRAPRYEISIQFGMRFGSRAPGAAAGEP
jgi:hypothetical protein